MDFHLDTLLNLPNAVVDSYSNTLDAIILKLQLINDGINCPNCNKYICKTHQTRPILVRDLSIFGQLVDLKVPRRQFYCPNCQTSPTEPLSVEVHGTKAEEKVEVHQNEQPKQIQPENQEYSALADLGKIQQ